MRPSAVTTDDAAVRPPLPADRIEHVDVVVVGARCAGAGTALLLARAGLRVVALDRAAEGSDTLSTHALLRAAVLQLYRWGVLDEIRAAGTPPIRRTVFRYGSEETVVTPRAFAGVDALYAPRRTVLDPALARAARAAGADVRFGHSVTGLLRAPDGRVAGVTGRDPDGASFAVRAPLTIGADGIRSKVAGWVGAPYERVGRAAAGVVYAYVPGLTGPGYEFFYNPGVTAGVMPTNGGDACVFVGVPSARFGAELGADGPAGFHRLLRATVPGLAARIAAAGEPVGFRSFPGVPGYFRRPVGPGWALVGDAGYFKDPLTMHGISDALRDAELLARAVVAGGPDGPGLPAELEGYHRTRNRLSADLFAATEAVASYRWDTDSVAALVRAASAATSDEVNALRELDEHAAVLAAG